MKFYILQYSNTTQYLSTASEANLNESKHKYFQNELVYGGTQSSVDFESLIPSLILPT